MAWEYKIVAMILNESDLNALGNDRWELIGVGETTGGGLVDCVFKREKRQGLTEVRLDH